MGMIGALADKRKAKLSDYIAAELPDSGEIEVMLPMVQTGNPRMNRGVGFYGIAITDDRVVITTYPKLVEQPDGVEVVYSRADVSVQAWKPKMISSKLEIGTPDGAFKVDIPGMHRQDGEALVAALGRRLSPPGPRPPHDRG